MSKDEWIAKCKARFIERCPDIGDDFAQASAETCFENNEDDFNECDPEDVADDEMSYWDDDSDDGELI